MKQIKAAAARGFQHRAIMPTASTTSPPPSCCAGLRPTLLHGWQQAFPLHPSPFRQMAAQSGASPQELLRVCTQMQRSGALQPIRPRWGEALGRERWRLYFEPGTRAAGLARALAALPGCLRIERTQQAPAQLWAELEAVDAGALHRQLARLPLQPTARLELSAATAQAGGPHQDPRLAACLEQGLALCANPFARCARALGCSERRLLACLHGWQRAGQLDGLVLAPPPPRGAQPGLIALWRELTPAPALLDALRRLPGLDRLVCAPPGAPWPWRLGLVLRGTPQLALPRLREQLTAAGLPTPPDACTPVLIERPRDAALLFAAQKL